MSVYSSATLKIYPSFQQYSDAVEFTSFICTNDNDDYISGDNVEWLYANLTLLTSTPDYRIFGTFCYKFRSNINNGCYTYVYVAIHR